MQVSESSVLPTLAPGTVLSGRYCVESVLGQGGMGAVYLAKNQALGDKQVAIKEMRIQTQDLKTHKQAVEQFRQEAKFLAHLEHPNLVGVSDFFEEDGRYYLVMAYVQGQTLMQALQARRGAFALHKVLDWSKQLCAVLDYLHSQNPPILFRDLKPSNIMLDRNETVRLIDFGIARSFDPEGGATATFLQGMGSAGYAPLEQYQGAGGTDPRSDIYSLGATMYHLLTNRVPASPVELVSEGTELDSPRRWNPTLPPAIEQVILKMMSLRKDSRYASIKQVQAALAQIERGLQQEDGTEMLGPVESARPTQVQLASPAVITQLTPPAPGLQSSSGDKTLWVTAVTLCGAALLLFGWLFLQAKAPPPTSATPGTPTVVVKAPESTPSPRSVVAKKAPPVAKPEPRPRTSFPVAAQPAPKPKVKPAASVSKPVLPDSHYPTVSKKPKPQPKPEMASQAPVVAVTPTPAPQSKQPEVVVQTVRVPVAHPPGHIPGTYPPGWRPGDPHPPPVPQHIGGPNQRPPGY